MNESLKKLYEIGSQYYDLGGMDKFAQKMHNEEGRRKFYGALSEHVNLGTFSEFEHKVQSAMPPPKEIGEIKQGEGRLKTAMRKAHPAIRGVAKGALFVAQPEEWVNAALGIARMGGAGLATGAEKVGMEGTAQYLRENIGTGEVPSILRSVVSMSRKDPIRMPEAISQKPGDQILETMFEMGTDVYGLSRVMKSAKRSEALRSPLKSTVEEVKSAQLLDDVVRETRAQKPLWEMSSSELELYKTNPKAIRAGEPNLAQKNYVEIDAMYKRNRDAIDLKNKVTFKKIKQTAVHAITDVSGNIKAELMKTPDGVRAVQRHDLAAGASSYATKLSARAEKLIYGGLNKTEKETLDHIINSRREFIIDSYKSGHQHTEGFYGLQHKDYIASLPPQLKNKLLPKAKEYFDTIRKETTKLYDEGLITKEQLQALNSHDYMRHKYLDYIDPDVTIGVGSRKITVPSSGIEKLKSGSTGYLELDSQSLLEETILRINTRIARNRANQALYDVAKNTPDNGMVRIIDADKKAPAGLERIDVMIDGKKHSMGLPYDMAKEWVTRDPLINSTLANWTGWVSGNKILKAMATGYNPEFAVSNLARDIAYMWMRTGEYSSFAPRAAVQMGIDYARVLPEAMGLHPYKGLKSVLKGDDAKTIFKATFNRAGDYEAYAKEGGLMSFLTHQGYLGKKTDPIAQVMGYMGETSEILTRLALRRRALKNGKSAEEATYIARTYLDFSQGGNVTKAVDSAVPYLNASIQATRGLFKTAKESPKTFTWKVAQLGSLASGLYYYNKFNNPKALEHISKRDRINNWIITTPFEFTTKNGETRHFFIKIPKDQAQRAFASAFEVLSAKAIGDEDVDYGMITQAMQDALPILPTENLPPTLDAFVGYAANYDFWKGEKIWRGDPLVEPKSQISEYTETPFIKIGETTGLSPEKTKFALQQIFTQGNVYTSMGGWAWKQILDETDDYYKNYTTEQIILRKPFVRRVLKETNPYNKYRDTIDKVEREVATDRHLLNLEVDKYATRFAEDDRGALDEAKTFINHNVKTPEDKERLIRRFKAGVKIKKLNIPERRYWLDLLGMNPEARAQVFWTRYNSVSAKEQQELINQGAQIEGMFTDDFKKRFNLLRNKGGKK